MKRYVFNDVLEAALGFKQEEERKALADQDTADAIRILRAQCRLAIDMIYPEAGNREKSERAEELYCNLTKPGFPVEEAFLGPFMTCLRKFNKEFDNHD